MTDISITVTHPHVSVLAGAQPIDGSRAGELHASTRLGYLQRLEKLRGLPIAHGCYGNQENYLHVKIFPFSFMDLTLASDGVERL